MGFSWNRWRRKIPGSSVEIDKRAEDEREETERAADKTDARTRIVSNLPNHPSAIALAGTSRSLSATVVDAHFDVSRILETWKYGLTGDRFCHRSPPMDETKFRESRVCRLLGNPVVYQLVSFLENGGPLTPSKLAKFAGRSVQGESGKR